LACVITEVCWETAWRFDGNAEWSALTEMRKWAQVEQLKAFIVPQPLVTMPLIEQPHIERYGTPEEPVFCVRNWDRRCGEYVKQLVENRGIHGNVVCDRNLDFTTNLRVKELETVARSITYNLAAIHADVPLLRHVDQFYDTEVLFSNPESGAGAQAPHRDIQPPGSLLFIFCCGLGSQSMAWPGQTECSLWLRSGDIMILDGGRTLHAVPKRAIVGTSPFSSSPWNEQRMVMLVRQKQG